MVEINLATSSEKSDGKKSSLGKAVPIAFAVLLIFLAAYGGLLFYKNSLNGQIIEISNQYNSRFSEVASGNTKHVLDYQGRMDVAKSLVGDVQKQDPNAAFSEIEKIMIPGVFIQSLKFDSAGNTLELVCATDNFSSVAKQMKGFKGTGYFSVVSEGATNITQSGMIEFPVVLKINSSK